MGTKKVAKVKKDIIIAEKKDAKIEKEINNIKGIDALMIILASQLVLTKNKENHKNLESTIEYLKNNLVEFNPVMEPDGFTVRVDFLCTEIDEKGDNTKSKIGALLTEDLFVVFAVNRMMGNEANFIDKLQKEKERNEDERKLLEKQKKDLEKREKALLKEETKKGKFKVPGHLKDQELKYYYPYAKKAPLFDILQTDTIKDIEVAGVERSEIIEGIKLSSSETKVINCLCKLLHENSQTLDAQKDDYYSGNMGYELVEYGGDKNTPAPKLAFTLYELTKEYKGGEYVSGTDITNVKKILTELNSKRFLIKYTETTKGKKGEWIKKEYEAFRRLIDVDVATLSYGVGDVEHYKKTETVIILNPIFRRQIDTKFILYPNDITLRTKIAYGNSDISEITLRLRDYLMRELSSKHPNPQISMDKLYWMLSEKWMKESRKKKVKDYTEKALETVTALGLLLSYEISTASTGEPKIIFTLNMEWE